MQMRSRFSDRWGGRLTRRHFLTATGSVLGVSLLAACGGSSSSTPTTASKASTTTSSAPTQASGARGAGAAGTPSSAPPAGTSSTAVASPAGGKQPKRGGTLTLAMNTDVDSVDPHKAAQNTADKVRSLVYSQLLKISYNREMVPDLAEKYEMVDPTTYVFHLRQNVKFHDGTPLTADDVVASYQRIIDPAIGSRLLVYLRVIDTITAKDANTVEFKLKNPQATFVPALALQSNNIAQKKKIDAKVDFEKDVVGTGPFKFVSRTIGVETKLTRNPDYFLSGLPYLDNVTLKPFDDDTARMNALLSGGADIGTFVPWANMAEFEKNPKFVFQSNKEDGFIMVEFRVDRPPFDNQKLRQAISYGIDRDAIIKTAASGRGKPCYGGIVPPWMWGYDKELENYYKYDPEKAKQLIKEAGAEGAKLELVTNPPTDALIGRPSVVVANQLNQLGLNVTLNQQANAPWAEIRSNGNYQFFADGSLYDIADPDFMSNYYQTGGRIPKANRFSDKQVDDWINQARQETDKDKRLALYTQIQQRVTELEPIAWLFYREQGDAWYPYVQGYAYAGLQAGANLLTQTWLDK